MKQEMRRYRENKDKLRRHKKHSSKRKRSSSSTAAESKRSRLIDGLPVVDEEVADDEDAIGNVVAENNDDDDVGGEDEDEDDVRTAETRGTEADELDVECDEDGGGVLIEATDRETGEETTESALHEVADDVMPADAAEDLDRSQTPSS